MSIICCRHLNLSSPMPMQPVSHPISALLFDLDGTLLDTAPDFHHVINLLRAEQQLPEIDFPRVRDSASNGAAAMIRACFTAEPESEYFTRLHQRLLDLYVENIAVHTRPFDGIPELLQWLERQQVPWGIVTNKPERFTRPLLEQLDLHRRCASVICPDQVSQRKPHPESLLLACQQMNCRPEQTIYVGDHQRDIEAGRRAGMTTIAALYGYIPDTETPADWQADLHASSAKEISLWIRQQRIAAPSREKR